MRNSRHLRLSQDERTPPAHAHHKPTRLFAPRPHVGPRAPGSGRGRGRAVHRRGRTRARAVPGVLVGSEQSGAVVAVGRGRRSPPPRCCDFVELLGAGPRLHGGSREGVRPRANAAGPKGSGS